MKNIFKKLFKKNREPIKLYKVTKVLNIHTGEYEEDEEILDEYGMSNLVVNGYLIEECEEI